MSDFSAGYGNTITSGFGLTGLFGSPSFTEWIRGSGNVVNFDSHSYFFGELGGYTWEDCFCTAVIGRGFGWTSKIHFDDFPPHYFPLFGRKLPHLQIDIWKIGVKGSRLFDGIYIPLPKFLAK